MNSARLHISGSNSFSIRLAHARAITMMLEDVSSVDLDTFTFTVSSESNTNLLGSRGAFVNWCKRLSEVDGNKIELQVSNL